MNENPPRRFAPIPLAVLAMCVLFALATPVLAATTVDSRSSLPTGVAATAVIAAMLLTWAVVGALTASRHPSNPVGWLFLVAGSLFTVGPFFDAYSAASRTGGGSLPGREHGAWIANVMLQNPAVFALFALVLLSFPDGRPLGAWTGRAARLLTGAAVTYTVLLALKPGHLAETVPPTDNPLGVGPVAALWQLVEQPLAIVFMLGCVGGIGSIVVRYRRASGVARQQLKWLLVGAIGLVLVVLSGPLFFWSREDLPEQAWSIVFISALMLLPLTAGFAMLRYRLYDIDRIVSRTASYLVIVAVLAAAYVGSTLLLSNALRPVTGSGDLPVALSTLLVAAAFHPVQRRVRAVVERRFNRRRYDAAAAIAGFGQVLRDEIDSAEVTTAVAQLARSTFEPEQVGLWLPVGRG